MQLYVLEQLGFRKVVDTSFIMGYMLGNETNLEDAERYFKALRHAQRDIDLQPELYKHHYLKELPEKFHSMVDVRLFGPGERIVFEPYTREAYEAAREWIAGHGIFERSGMGGGRYEDAILAVAPWSTGPIGSNAMRSFDLRSPLYRGQSSMPNHTPRARRERQA
jgi:hypothetical protein